MNKKDVENINNARLELLEWVRQNKNQTLKYANKTALYDKINSVLMPLLGD